jgi:DNA repair photolyase
VTLRPVSNPPNPWLSTEVEYLDEIPEARLEVIEDSSRSILAHNDSPDVGFDWSVNPYRGCQHACAYCVGGDTRILMGDGSTKPICALRVGDLIYGTRRIGQYRRYVQTEVLAHWQTRKPAYRVRLADGTELIASGDHRFLTERGWKYVTAAEYGQPSRPYLNTTDELIGFGASPERLASDRLGQLSALFRGGSPLRVVSLESLGRELPMYDITTGTGDFIAEGVVSHNCYARPSHEYLSMGAGTDFDRKIVVKPEAPRLLREAFEKKSWKGELVVFSGVTDCYQPLEASYRLTRGCLEVCAEYANPVGIITKAPLIERDLDVLIKLAQVAKVSVSISVPFWDPEKARAIEPFVATPERRVRAIAKLAAAGIDVGVMCAPMIPALGDEEIPKVLEAAAAAGAKHAGFVFLRLPGSVKAVFEERVRAALPLRADHILSRVREARGGKLYDSRFGTRGRGEGPYAEQARALFETTARKFGLSTGCAAARAVSDTTFRRPPKRNDQLSLL